MTEQTVLEATAATLKGALANALATQWAVLALPSAETSQDLKEVVESTLLPVDATASDCSALVAAFIAKVNAEAAGKNVVVLRAPDSDVFVAGQNLSAYATVLLGFLTT